MKLVLAFVLLVAPLEASIPCAVKVHIPEKREIVIECPPPQNYSPVRVELFLRGEIPTLKEGTLCRFEATDTEQSLEYKDDKGRKHWTKLEKQALTRFRILTTSLYY